MITSRSPQRGAGRAFTLIELLVVIAIIALLMAILLPSLTRSRQQARAVKCSSHLRSLGMGLSMYATEYDGYIPRDITPQPWPFAAHLVEMLGHELDPTKQLAGQFKEIEALQCPDFPLDNYDPLTGQAIQERTLDFIVNGFSKLFKPGPGDELRDKVNVKGRWQGDQDNNDPPEQLGEIKNIAGLVYIAEANRFMPSGYTTDPGQAKFLFHDFWRGRHLPRGDNPRMATDRRHPAGINMLYFDAHAAPMLPEKVDLYHFYFPGY